MRQNAKFYEPFYSTNDNRRSKGAMKYRYQTWCRFCVGSDDPICDDIETSDEAFDTLELARQAAKDCCKYERLMAVVCRIKFRILTHNASCISVFNMHK